MNKSLILALLFALPAQAQEAPRTALEAMGVKTEQKAETPKPEPAKTVVKVFEYYDGAKWRCGMPDESRVYAQDCYAARRNHRRDTRIVAAVDCTAEVLATGYYRKCND